MSARGEEVREAGNGRVEIIGADGQIGVRLDADAPMWPGQIWFLRRGSDIPSDIREGERVRVIYVSTASYGLYRATRLGYTDITRGG